MQKLEYYFAAQLYRKVRTPLDGTFFGRCACRTTDLSHISNRILTTDERYTEAFSTFSRIRNTWLPSPHTVDKSQDGRAGYICACNSSWTDAGRRSRRTSARRPCDSTRASSSFRKSRSNPQAREN